MKKILASVLVLAFVLSTSLVALAAPVGVGTDSSNATITSNTNVEYSIDIPASVDFGTLRREAGTATVNYTIDATYVVLEPDCRVYITAAPTGTIANTLDNLQTLTFSNSLTALSVTEEGSTAGTLSLDKSTIKYAGHYTGTLIFNISYRSVYELVSVSETRIGSTPNSGTMFAARYDIGALINSGDVHIRPAFTFNKNISVSKVSSRRTYYTPAPVTDTITDYFLSDPKTATSGNGAQIFEPRGSLLSGQSDTIDYDVYYNGAYAGSYSVTFFVS